MILDDVIEPAHLRWLYDVIQSSSGLVTDDQRERAMPWVKRMMESIDPVTGAYSVTYSPKNEGRRFAHFGLGFQGSPRWVRHTLGQHLRDIDIANCHPNLLKSLCGDANISCTHLTSFIEDRESYYALAGSPDLTTSIM